MPKLQLRIQPPDGPSFRREVESESFVLGRSAKADLVVPDQFVSRQHARLFRTAQGWFVESLGSKNPTFVNQVPVSGPTRLAPGDVLRLAETLVYLDDEAEPADAMAAIFRSALAIDAGAATHAAQGVAAEASPQAQRLRSLNEVHRALAGPISLADLLELLLDRTFADLKPEEGVVYLKNASGEFEVRTSRRQAGLGGSAFASRRLLQEVTGKGLAALVLDAGSDARFATAESVVLSGVRSIVAAPLLDADGCLGMIALNSRAHVRRFSEEDMELLVSLASAAALRIRNIALAAEAAERQVLERELALANEIQMGMLPKQLPQRREIEVFAELRPATSVGGDLYDFRIAGDRLWFVLGDVSGKGVAAALFMAMTQALFRAFSGSDASVGEVATRMNHGLAYENDRGMFVTAFLGCLDLVSGDLEFVNAGHNYPVRIKGRSGVDSIRRGHAVALGAIESHCYRSETERLEPGELIYLYTDGVTEALDDRGRHFTLARLLACLGGLGRESAAEVVRTSLRELEGFVGDAPRSDDVAVMAIRFRGGA